MNGRNLIFTTSLLSWFFITSDRKLMNHDDCLMMTDSIEHIIGADISFLPQMEAEGKKIYDNGVQKDGLTLLKDYKFNYIRLRIFHDPTSDSGYSKLDYCGLDQTLKMAKRIKDNGFKFLLDFHYSDNWADPQKQFKPKAWVSLPFDVLVDSVNVYTAQVLKALKAQNTLPDMIQIGNEINHGILWPSGQMSNPDSLAALLKAGVSVARQVAPSAKIMLHIACGGDNVESVSFLDNMIRRGVKFDVIGESYYPRWHGTTQQLQSNLDSLSKKYQQDVIVAEYSQFKREVNDIAESVPEGNMKGAFIWEPYNWGEKIVDDKGNINDSMISIYPAIAKKYK